MGFLLIMSKIDTEEIVRRFKVKYPNNEFDYSKVKYEKSNIPVEIHCNTHNITFFKLPFTHLQESGCKLCAKLKFKKSKTFTTEQFIEKSLIVHGTEKYNYDQVNYIDIRTNVSIYCNVHKAYFDQLPTNHLKGCGCPKCAANLRSDILKLSKEKFLSRLPSDNFKKYNYDSIEFENVYDKIKIFCFKHNEFFEQSVSNHLYGDNGCPKCANERTGLALSSSTEEFVSKSFNIHKGYYTYKNSKYLGAHKKLLVTCPIHSDFLVTPSEHLSGTGCKKCAVEKLSIRMRENPVGWSYSNWKLAGEKSKNFDGFKVYIIEMSNNIEKFLKIGRTYKTVESRFGFSKDNYYQINGLKTIIFEDAIKVCNLESLLKNQFKEYKYLPLINFNGMHECFNISAKDEILKYINNYETTN